MSSSSSSSSSYDNSESYQKYPDFPLEMPPSQRDKFLGFKPLSLTKNTKKPLKPAASLTEAGLSAVRVMVYPARQTVLAGQDAVVQCRDEGDLRTRVSWHRSGARQLPVNSRQEAGRLELYRVREEDGGEYTCRSLYQGAAPGASQTSSIEVVTPTSPVP